MAKELTSHYKAKVAALEIELANERAARKKACSSLWAGIVFKKDYRRAEMEACDQRSMRKLHELEPRTSEDEGLMSDEMDRKIAEFLEPMPTWKAAALSISIEPGTALFTSDAGVWQRWYVNSVPNDEPVVPRDMTTPEMTVLLLEKMPEGAHVWMDSVRKWYCRVGNEAFYGSTIGEAVKLAFQSTRALSKEEV